MAKQSMCAGYVLQNGATVLMYTYGKLLARWFRGGTAEYVVWSYTQYNDYFDCYWGHYFNNPNQALKCFRTHCGIW